MIVQRVFDKDRPQDAVKIVMTAQEMDALYDICEIVTADPGLRDDVMELASSLHFSAYAFAVGDGDLQ